MTPYYDQDGITIYHARCEDVLPTLTDVDLFFTSPPYNLGTTNGAASGMHAGSLAAKSLAGGYATYDDAMPQEEYDAWQRMVVLLMWRALSTQGAIFYNHKPRSQNGKLILPTEYGTGLPLRQIITWDRETGMNFSRRFFLPKQEWIVVWAKNDWQLVDKTASQVGDVWRVRPEQADEHPAPFPVGLPARAIEATQTRLVVDPFMGSGTTLRAAKNAGRRAIGIELDERYCEVAARRLGQQTLDFGGAA